MAKALGKRAPNVLAAFEGLRHQPPHMLLASLQRHLLLECNLLAGAHFEGLAQAGRELRPMIGNAMASKFRLIDEAHNIVRHLSPESCAIYPIDLAAAALASTLKLSVEEPAGEAQVDEDTTLGDRYHSGDDTLELSSIEAASNICCADLCHRSIAVGTDMPLLGAIEAFNFYDEELAGDGEDGGNFAAAGRDEPQQAVAWGTSTVGKAIAIDDVAADAATGNASARVRGPGLELRGGADEGAHLDGVEIFDASGNQNDDDLMQTRAGMPKRAPWADESADDTASYAGSRATISGPIPTIAFSFAGSNDDENG
jgi:hypothetical protein